MTHACLRHVALLSFFLQAVLGCSDRFSDCTASRTCAATDSVDTAAGVGGETQQASKTDNSKAEPTTSSSTPSKDESDTENTPLSACAETCSGKTPACDSISKTCVECVTDAHCGGDTPACDANLNQCVSCTDDKHCAGETPACDKSKETCVGCLKDSHCEGSTPVCDINSQACVACLTSDHCPASAPVCDVATKSCGRCKKASDCSRFSDSGATLCSLSNETIFGQCVSCDPSNLPDYCDGFVCSPKTGTCDTSHALHSKTTCETCSYDADCESGSYCMPTLFDDGTTSHDEGYRCQTSGCNVGFFEFKLGTSIDGAVLKTCAPEPGASCDAYLDFNANKACDDASDCGNSWDNAICKNYAITGPANYRCGLPCGSGTDYSCPPGNSCINNACWP